MLERITYHTGLKTWRRRLSKCASYLNCGHVHSQKDPLFQQFIILVSVEGLENKYNLELSRGALVCV